jgi:uncharacterized protein DUF1326
MRTLSALVLMIVAAAAIAILAPHTTVAAAAPNAATYDVTADTIEGCSCPLFCPCYFGASNPEHMCQFTNVYKFRPGSHYGAVDLSNKMVWMNGDLGGEWHHKPGPGMPTNWVTITHDKATSPEQRAAIEKVLGSVFNVTWKKVDKREDTIEWHDEKLKAYAKLASGTSEISLDKNATMRPDTAMPTVIKNLQYWFSTSNEGFVLAPSTHKFNGTTSFSHENKNGFTIAWTAKGDVKPAGSAGR